MRRKKASHTTTAEPTVLSRRSFMREIGIACLGCALFLSPWNLSAWNTVQGNNAMAGTIQETKTMKLAQQSSQSTAADRTIPPIDAAAPTKTETATFAMG
jgi:ferric-dicitrate binding protein FerR (iron transport regulator)